MSNKRPIIGLSTYFRKMTERAVDVYALNASYIEAVTAAGGIPILIPVGLSDDDLQAIFERVDGVLIPGGGDIEPSRYGGNNDYPDLMGVTPARDETELYLTRRAVEEEKPLMAICRGHQVFNVALGGTLHEDISDQIEGAIKHDYFSGVPRTHIPHHVDIEPDSLLFELIGKTKSDVNSFHHQAIKELAPDLRSTAFSPDGIIEGIEIPDHPFALGVQWHPENLIHSDPAMLRLFKGFVAASTPA